MTKALTKYDHGSTEPSASRAPLRPMADAWFHLMRIGWGRLGLLATVGYTVAVLTFWGLYLLGGPETIDGAEDRWDVLWYSAHTLSTLGSEGMAPATAYGHGLTVLESLTGLAALAVYTAVLIARFARPTARVAFADVAVVQPRNGVPSLQIRLANERPSAILGARLTLSVLMEDITAEGQHMRRMRDLKLMRHEVPMMALTWTAIHLLDESSPLHGLTPENAPERLFFLFASFEGMDETFGQKVNARYRYAPEDMRFGRCYADMVEHLDDGLVVHLARLHQTVDVADGTIELDDPLDAPD